MKTEVVTITPEMAADWLERWNLLNRPVTQSNVDKITRIITEGRWLLTGDAITFSDQRLIQGQHRLLAIIAAGIPVRSLVIWGVEDCVFDVLDQGKRRTVSDVLASHGQANTTAMAAMMPIIQAYGKGLTTLQLHPGEKLDHSQVAAMITEEHALAARKAQTICVKGALSPGMAAAAFFLSRQMDSDLASVFWSDVVSPVKTSHNAGMLFSKLVNASLGSSMKPTNEARWTWCIIAWNAERRALKLSGPMLRYVAGQMLPKFQ